MDKPHTLFGMPVYESNLLTKPGPTTWVDRVIAWNPCNDWSPPRVPSDEMFMVNMDAMRIGFDVAARDGQVAFVMHPSYVQVIEPKQMFRMRGA